MTNSSPTNTMFDRSQYASEWEASGRSPNKLNTMTDNKLQRKVDKIRSGDLQIKTDKDSGSNSPIDNSNGIQPFSFSGTKRAHDIPVRINTLNSGLSNELSSNLIAPDAQYLLNGDPYTNLSEVELLTLAANRDLTLDTNKEKLLTSLRGQISKELARYDAERSFRETMRSGLAQSLAGFMG